MVARLVWDQVVRVRVSAPRQKNMQLKFENIKESPVTLFRRAGYVFQRKESNEMSFIRPMARAGFPRFHIYASISGTVLLVNIHLDQKKETYGSGTRHHGEYEDDGALKPEIERLETIFSRNETIVYSHK